MLRQEEVDMAKWIACLFACLVAAEGRADVTAEIRAHEEAFARACEAGNVDAVLALYTDDASVVWPGAGEEGKGKAAIEELATGFCKGARNLKLTLKSLDVIGLDDTHAATVGHWEGASTGPGGKRMTGAIRATEVLVKSDGGWRYLIDHASAGVTAPRPVAAPRRPRRER